MLCVYNDDGRQGGRSGVKILVALGIQLARKRNGRWEYRPSDSFLKKTAGRSRGGLRVPRDPDYRIDAASVISGSRLRW